MSKALRTILLVIFSLIFLVSAVMLTRELLARRESAQYLKAVQSSYEPELRRPEAPAVPVTSEVNEGVEDAEAPEAPLPDLSNPEIRELVEQYPDAVGWLTVEGAGVSHPFAVGEDNATYIRAQLDGSYVRSGTLFMDYRNSREMTDRLTVIYGHNMNNGTMFSNLADYLKQKHLEAYPDVYVSLPDTTLHYQIWAVMVGDAVSDPVFTSVGNPDSMQQLLTDIAAKAECLNPNPKVNRDSQLLVLSTCNPSYFYARTLLICVLDM